ncbi:hypothetical protein PhaeoP72_02924 [Phaeobacter inhibens]|nr:hypothetical protein PhaeoP72_02924 [Phaeobacter inhibens]
MNLVYSAGQTRVRASSRPGLVPVCDGVLNAAVQRQAGGREAGEPQLWLASQPLHGWGAGPLR